MSEVRPIPRSRRKTRSGCLRCKQRKIKCDETLPQCNQCTRKALDCPGYVRPLKWSSKYETWNSNNTLKEASRDLNRSVRHLTNNAKEHDNVLLETPTDLAHVEGSSSVERGPAPTSHHQNHTINTNSSEADISFDPDKLLEPFLFSRSSTENLLFDTTMQGQSIDIATLWDDLLAPSPQITEDRSTRLSRHYFSTVCRINCCFDSSKNLFRVWVAESMHSCPLLYHCILSMSASHLAVIQQSDLVPVALEHRAEAMSRLGTEILGVDLHSNSKPRSSFEGISQALVSCILLGMTDGWHNPSILGITHLHGARILFKKWLAVSADVFETSLGQQKLSSVRSFLVGTMAYWEAMASFVLDQPIQSVSYLLPICDQTGTEKIQPNPWTGISTPLFAYLAQAGALGRQRSIIRNLTVPNSSTGIHENLLEELLVQVRGVEDALLNYKIPSADLVEDTGDALTPVNHLQKMAQVYRLTALLEIYRVFPELLHGQSSGEVSVSNFKFFKARTLAIAVGILTIISTIPASSGVNVLFCLPIISAGSALQFTGSQQTDFLHGSSRSSLCSDLMAIFIQDDGHAHWREFVQERMNAIHDNVGLGGVTRALEVIEKTWLRADIQVFANESGSVGEFIHWTDVMADERLETIFG